MSGSDPYRSRELATVGAIIDIVIQGRAASAAPVEGRGLIDTGASGVFLDRRLALQAGLRAVDSQPVEVPGGLTVQATVYSGWLEIPVLQFREQMRFHAATHRQASHDVLLGRSVLRHFLFTYDGPNETFSFHRPFIFPGPQQDEDYAT